MVLPHILLAVSYTTTEPQPWTRRGAETV